MRIDNDRLNSFVAYSLIITLIALVNICVVMAVKAQLPELPPIPPLTQEAEDSRPSQQQQESGNFSSALDSRPSQQTETSGFRIQEPTTNNNSIPFDEIFKTYGDSIAGITPTTDELPSGTFLGTGFLVGKEGRILHLVTPAHVISGYEAEPVNVVFPDGSIYEAKVLGSNARSDIALLQIRSNSTEDPFEPINLGNSSEVSPGQEVLAIGNSGLTLGTIPNFAMRGIVGASGVTTVGAADVVLGAIATDFAVAGGSSGSPLFNHKGEAIGMVVAGEDTYNTYSVPYKIIKKVTNSLAETGEYEYKWIGLNHITLTAKDV